jgi:gas vesicle protein
MQHLAKEDRKMARRKMTALGILAVGAGIGATVALLYAPRAGKHTRRKLAHSANKALNQLEDMRENIQTQMTDWMDGASHLIVTGRDSAKDMFDRANKSKVGRYLRSVAG